MQKYCKHCGTKNNDKSKFCRYCGENLSEAQTVNSDNKINGKNHKILIGIIVALLIIISIFGTYVFFVSPDNNNNSSSSNVSFIDNINDTHFNNSSNINTKSSGIESSNSNDISSKKNYVDVSTRDSQNLQNKAYDAGVKAGKADAREGKPPKYSSSGNYPYKAGYWSAYNQYLYM